MEQHTIYHVDGSILHQGEAETFKEFVEKNKEKLEGANLEWADLMNADLWEANLWAAKLENANLIGADLWEANLEWADLMNADLMGANLMWADLFLADLRGAKLARADLRKAKNIPEHYFTLCKRDILNIFHYLPNEVAGLRQKIIEGKIDGTQYTGECCCLIGSLGDDKAISKIPYYKKGLHNYGEQLFYQIRKGDCPETNQFSKIALAMCNEFLRVYEGE